MSFREIPTLKAFRDVCINYGFVLAQESHLKALQTVHGELPGVVIQLAEQKRGAAFDKMETWLKELEDYYGPR